MTIKGFSFSLSLVWPHADITLTSLVSHFYSRRYFTRDRNHIWSHEAQSPGSIINGARLTLPCSCTRQTLPGHLPWQRTSYPVNQRAWHPPISLWTSCLTRSPLKSSNVAPYNRLTRRRRLKTAGHFRWVFLGTSTLQTSKVRAEFTTSLVQFNSYHRFEPHTCMVCVMWKNTLNCSFFLRSFGRKQIVC